jgi:predicted secreted protein
MSFGLGVRSCNGSVFLGSGGGDTATGQGGEGPSTQAFLDACHGGGDDATGARASRLPQAGEGRAVEDTVRQSIVYLEESAEESVANDRVRADVHVRTKSFAVPTDAQHELNALYQSVWDVAQEAAAKSRSGTVELARYGVGAAWDHENKIWTHHGDAVLRVSINSGAAGVSVGEADATVGAIAGAMVPAESTYVSIGSLDYYVSEERRDKVRLVLEKKAIAQVQRRVKQVCVELRGDTARYSIRELRLDRSYRAPSAHSLRMSGAAAEGGTPSVVEGDSLGSSLETVTVSATAVCM